MRGETLEHYISLMREEIYRLLPELVPFGDGDRAGMLGQETAQDFARRKLLEQSRNARSGRTRRRGPLNGHKPGELAGLPEPSANL